MGCAEWVNGPASRTFSGSTWDVVKMMIGEFLGTFILCFLGIATCLTWIEGEKANIVQIAFGFGLTIAGVIYMMGPISGAHINPAITVASMISGRINATKGLLYILFQSLGAIAGSGALWFIQVNPNVGPTSFGLTLPHPAMSSAQALLAEILLTMIFVLVFLSVTDSNWSYVKGSASTAIGFTATACHLAFVFGTGTSINPARSLGPAIIMAHFEHLWIYWVGPLTGSALAAFLYKALIYVPKESEEPPRHTEVTTATENGKLDEDDFADDPYVAFEEVVIDDGPSGQPPQPPQQSYPFQAAPLPPQQPQPIQQPQPTQQPQPAQPARPPRQIPIPTNS